MFYHKVYMNQIHSSSLLCQLASMWKNQVLCDAVIKAGNNHIKVSLIGVTISMLINDAV